MFLTPEQIKEYGKQYEKVAAVVKELGEPDKARNDIIVKRFGGFRIFISFLISQLIIGFEHDKNLKKAYLDCVDKRPIITSVGVCTEIGYMIAEERYEQQIKMLKAKLMIAEGELEKTKKVSNGESSHELIEREEG